MEIGAWTEPPFTHLSPGSPPIRPLTLSVLSPWRVRKMGRGVMWVLSCGEGGEGRAGGGEGAGRREGAGRGKGRGGRGEEVGGETIQARRARVMCRYGERGQYTRGKRELARVGGLRVRSKHEEGRLHGGNYLHSHGCVACEEQVQPVCQSDAISSTIAKMTRTCGIHCGVSSARAVRWEEVVAAHGSILCRMNLPCVRLHTACTQGCSALHCTALSACD